MRIKALIASLSIALAVTGCTSGDANSAKPVSSNGVNVSGNLGTAPVVTFDTNVVSPDQLVIQDIAVGTGATAVATSTVTTHYIGYGMNTKQKFDSSWDRNEPTTFGLNQVIQGWSQGIPGMKVGGRRLLIIPGYLAYGPSGSGQIQPNEALVFVVDLVAVQ